MTPLDIITAAMRDIGALALEEFPTNAEGEAGLYALNDMIDAWNTDGLMVYDISPSVFPLIGGQASYTYGTGGNFNAARPTMIESAFIRDANNNDYPLFYTTDYNDYSQIISKGQQSDRPIFVYDDTNFPLRTLTLYPVPSTGFYSLVLWVTGLLTNLGDINAQLNIPPAYARAFKKNLAVEIAPAFQVEPSATLARQALDSKAQISRINLNIQDMNIDPALGHGQPYNVYTNYYGPF